MIGTVETARAHSAVHPGAVYLHMGSAYEVEELDLAGAAGARQAVHRRLVHAAEEGDRHLDRAGARHARGGRRARCRSAIVSVTEQVIAFQRKRVSDHEVLDFETVDLPEQQFVTQALWYELPDAVPGATTSRSTCSRARCTPPSTRRSRCCR